MFINHGIWDTLCSSIFKQTPLKSTSKSTLEQRGARMPDGPWPRQCRLPTAGKSFPHHRWMAGAAGGTWTVPNFRYLNVKNWGKPCFSWMRIERLSVHYWGNQRCSMVCLRPSKEHCQFFQEILALKLQYPTKVEKTRLTWSKKQPFGLVKGRIFPDSFCTCCSCYNESHEPKWPETVLFF